MTSYDGPLATKWLSLWTDEECSAEHMAAKKLEFVKAHVLPVLKNWSTEPTTDSNPHFERQVLDSFDIAWFCLWVINDPDVNEHPDQLPKFSRGFLTSCKNLARLAPDFINEGCENYPGQLAISMLLDRAKEDLRFGMGWE